MANVGMKRSRLAEEALSLGSVSQIVMPSELRSVIGQHLMFCLRHYEPGPMGGVQREFH